MRRSRHRSSTRWRLSHLRRGASVPRSFSRLRQGSTHSVKRDGPVRRQVLTLGSVYVLPCGIDSLFGIRRAHNRFITALVSAVIGDRECCAPAWCKGASPCLRTPRPQRARSAASRCILYLSKQVDVNSVASTAFRYNRQRSQSHSREPYGRLSNAASSFKRRKSPLRWRPIDRRTRSGCAHIAGG
jgi:hypothetical protein